MKIIYNIILLASIFILTMSFSFFRKKDYSDIAVEIRNKTGKELAKKHRMDVIAVGGGMMDCVRKISLSFQIYRILNQDEARCIIIDCVEELLKAFNENEAIRPHLANYPFTCANLDIRMFISTPERGDVYYPNFCIVGVYNEEFVTYKCEDDFGNSLKPTVESYQEALLKVKSGNI